MDMAGGRNVRTPGDGDNPRKRFGLSIAGLAWGDGQPGILPALRLQWGRAASEAAAIRAEDRPLRSMDLRWDMELLARAVGPQAARDIGARFEDALDPAKAREGVSSRVRSPETNRQGIKQTKEVGMAPEMTPRAWPSENRGLADDVAGLAGIGALAGRLAAKLAARFAPWGRVAANLSQGQTVVLEGSRMARVDCLEGAVWVTCPSDGRDLRMPAGKSVSFPGGGMVAVTAMDGPARVRLGWW